MSALLVPLLWSAVPSQLSHMLVPRLSSALPGVFPPAPKSSPQYRTNYRIVYTALVIGYLVYQLASTGSGGDNWYTLLGVGRSADDDALKKAFRSLYHPDRNPGQEATFIQIRQAYEIISDPVRRYAYDRFGPSVVTASRKTVKDYMYAGLGQSLGFYIASFSVMLLLTLTGQASRAAHWRYTLFAVLLALELKLVLSPTPLPTSLPLFSPLSIIAPSYLIETPQFLWVQSLHGLWAATSIALTQLAGVWSESEPVNSVEGLVSLIHAVDIEASSQFHAEVGPLLATGNPRAIESAYNREMEAVLVDQYISSHPVVREAYIAATRKAVLLRNLELAKQIPLPPSPRLTPA